MLLDVSTGTSYTNDPTDIAYRNLPIGAVSTAIIIPCLKIGVAQHETKVTINAKLKQFDFFGIATIIIAVCCLILSLQWAQESGNWGQSRVVGCFVGAFLLIIAFGIIQHRRGNTATIPLSILRQRSIFMGAWYLFFLEMAIYVVRRILV